MEEKDRRQLAREEFQRSRILLIQLSPSLRQKNLYVNVVDVSKKGLKIITDTPLKIKEKKEFAVKLFLYNPLSTIAKLVWAKELFTNIYAYGLEFPYFTEQDSKEMLDFLKNTALEERRKSIRIRKPILTEIKYANKSFFTYAMEISPQGCRIVSDKDIDKNYNITLKFITKTKYVYTNAKIVWSKSLKYGYLMGLKFTSENLKKLEKDILELIEID